MFMLLGAARAWYFGTPVLAELVPLTGIAFVLFTFYMITDPQTSPSRIRSQFFFGAGIALAYSVLLMLHVQYTMFYSVTVIAATRGMYLYAISRRAPAAVPAAVSVGPVRLPEGAAAMRRGDRSAGAA